VKENIKRADKTKTYHIVIFLSATLVLLIGGLLRGVSQGRNLTPWEAFSGFSRPATVSVAAVLVLSAAIEHTGWA
jgi:hypothetical protein